MISRIVEPMLCELANALYIKLQSIESNAFSLSKVIYQSSIIIRLPHVADQLHACKLVSPSIPALNDVEN